MSNVEYKNNVDWSGRREDACGSTVQGRPRRRKRRGGSPKRPRTARAWSGNQHTRLQSILIEVNSFAMELTFLIFKGNHNDVCKNSLNLIENNKFYKIE